jgi:nucleotide-binding universal stress UspA family protein
MSKMSVKEFLSRILIPVDGSDSSLMAEEVAAVIAKKSKATVTVFHASSEVLQGIGYPLPSSLEKEILGQVEQRGGQIVNDALALFKEEGVTADAKMLSRGDPADSILTLSKGYDLIIIGAHGENEKDPYALGSETKKVIRHTERPTLIIKKINPLSKLLVCIDGSEHSIRAFEYALRFAEKMGSSITLLNVQEPQIYDISPKTAAEIGEKILSKALNLAEGEKRKVDKRVKFGIPSVRITEVAEEGNYDLIVLGSRGLGTIRRFLLGGVSDDVSNYAKCSILVIPAKY